jgi:glycosyltransferase involved in cell wall biosynthesis
MATTASEVKSGQEVEPGQSGNGRLAIPYLMVIVQIPLYRDASGRLFTNELWQRDLLRHLDHLSHFIIACPCLNEPPPADALPLDYDAATTKFEVVELPVQKSMMHSLLLSPRIISRLWSAIRRAGVVHSAVAGWPVPMGWFVMPIARLLGKPSVIIVESAPWRTQESIPAGFVARLRSSAHEFLSRLILRRADLPIFTQEGYRDSLLGSQSARGHILPASWIEESDILNQYEADRSWDQKLASPKGTFCVIFAGRLTREKGVLVLLDAMRELSKEGVPITLDILGEGALKEDCERASAELTGETRIRVLGTVPYGAPFFEAVREHDAVVIPTISDEQPRLVFDAYSQAVPVIASDTAGLRSCVVDGKTGYLLVPNDHMALAALLRRSVPLRAELRRLGLQSLAYARTRTHQQMHRDRAVLLHRYFGAKESA